MSERVQLDYLLLDCDFLNKPKIIALRSRYGHVTALYLIQILSALSRATDAKMDVYAAYGLASSFDISKEDAIKVINHCVKEDILQLQDEELTQRRVAEDQEKLAKGRKRRQQAQAEYRQRKEAEELSKRQSRDNHEDRESDTTPVTDTLTDTLTDTDTVTEYNKQYGFSRPRLKLTQDQFDSWVINWHNGNELEAISELEAAADHLKAHGKPEPDDAMAYMRGWRRKSAQFQKPPIAAKPRKTNHEKNLELIEKLRQEESNA